MPTGRPDHRPRVTPEAPCLNCGDPTRGNYCPNCGQAKRDVAVSVGALLADVLEDQFVLSRALPRTLKALLLRPGFLTREYVDGRRASYITPFRLYLASSVLFFLMFAVFGLGSLQRSDRAVGVDANPSVITESGQPDMGGQVDLPEVQPWARNMDLNMGSEETNRRVRQRIYERYGRLEPTQALRAFLLDYLHDLPRVVFLLLPLFALLLKILYIRSGRFYAEHFVFSLHVHAFAFAVATVGLLFSWAMWASAIALATTLYVWLALRTVHGQGMVWTTVKTFALGLAYSFFLMFAFLGSVVVALNRL